ncbi:MULTISPECIES: alpha/beta fold hydrolase [unclassified Thermoactinomyces]|uniref:alpha/beta fold hydrolase n=1 Tax=Thermoactinomyces TaxID=2023 RepID=UPI0018DB35FB|nr:alpha/beta hydrolase [Thermoactinomyces sp. CICC 10735]MBH8583387.1 alpha/beta hydrolase [Thermoactinomyces sp. CICC 10735]
MPFLDCGGTRLYYESEGNGPAIIFIHPPLITSRVFRYQKEDLKHRYQLILFDVRGHGFSGPSRQPVTYPLIIQDLCRLMDHLQIEKAYLAGYSTGGSVALNALHRHPERFLGGILISALSEISDPIIQAELDLAVALCNRIGFPFLSRSICMANAGSRKMFSYLHAAARVGNPENIKQYFQYSQTFNGTKLLPGIQAPVLVFSGTRNDRFRKYTEVLTKNLPNSTHFPLNHKPHHLITRAARQLNQAIRAWLALYETTD